MPGKKAGKDHVLLAVGQVHAALKDLKPEERGKVISSVGALLEMTNLPPSAASAQQERTVAEAKSSGALRPSSRPVSIVELMQEKHPGTNQQKIALFAYYREKHESKPRFSRADLEAYFAKAKETPPANYDRDFAETVRKGWIHEDGDESYVTSKGIEVVESGFPAERKYSARPKEKARQGTKAKKGRSKR